MQSALSGRRGRATGASHRATRWVRECRRRADAPPGAGVRRGSGSPAGRRRRLSRSGAAAGAARVARPAGGRCQSSVPGLELPVAVVAGRRHRAEVPVAGGALPAMPVGRRGGRYRRGGGRRRSAGPSRRTASAIRPGGIGASRASSSCGCGAPPWPACFGRRLGARDEQRVRPCVGLDRLLGLRMLGRDDRLVNALEWRRSPRCGITARRTLLTARQVVPHAVARCVVECSTSTAPAVTSAAAASPAAALVATAPMPAPTKPTPLGGARRQPRSPGGSGARSQRPVALGAGGVAEMDQRELLEDHQRADRQQRRQRLVRVAQLDAEVRAAIAGLQVPAHERAGAAAEPLGDLAELDPDLARRRAAATRRPRPARRARAPAAT